MVHASLKPLFRESIALVDRWELRNFGHLQEENSLEAEELGVECWAPKMQEWLRLNL